MDFYTHKTLIGSDQSVIDQHGSTVRIDTDSACIAALSPAPVFRAAVSHSTIVCADGTSFIIPRDLAVVCGNLTGGGIFIKLRVVRRDNSFIGVCQPPVINTDRCPCIVDHNRTAVCPDADFGIIRALCCRAVARYNAGVGFDRSEVAGTFRKYRSPGFILIPPVIANKAAVLSDHAVVGNDDPRRLRLRLPGYNYRSLSLK